MKVAALFVEGGLRWIPPCRKKLEKPGDYL